MIIPVNLESDSYEITLERGSLNKIGEILDLKRRVLIVTDKGVPRRYANTVWDAVDRADGTPVFASLEEGEESKTLDNFAELCRIMLKHSFSRNDCVIAVGGGVVGDLAGFAAACYMRGIDFYNIPTTLLSQVDSSVGGKTAVDFGGIKNIVGAFHQPRAVIIDPDVLDTLDNRQFAGGSAEIIKMAMTFDKELFELIEAQGIRANLEEIIARSLKLKAYVVQNDEKESGLRKVLNFGHTLGHGIESMTDMIHGECVALGILPMTDISLRNRVKSVLAKEGLPVSCMVDVGSVIDAAMHDKKADGGEVLTVRVKELGTYCFEKADRNRLTEDFKEVFR